MDASLEAILAGSQIGREGSRKIAGAQTFTDGEFARIRVLAAAEDPNSGEFGYGRR